MSNTTPIEIDLDGNITEQRYIELANHFKEIMEEKDREIAQIKRDGKKRERLFFKMFGCIEVLHDSLCYLQDEHENDDFVMFYKLLEYLHNEFDNM